VIPSLRALARLIASLGFCLAAAAPAADEFEIGGPLAGLKTPRLQTKHGPGPEVELSPGAAEHWRGYYMKYLPMRSFSTGKAS